VTPVRSFDSPRGRPAPTSISGHTLSGESVTHEMSGLTLVVAVKTSCDGCRDFVHSDLEELSDVTVLIVSATNDLTGEWDGAVQQVIVAPEALTALDVRWPPFYVLVSPDEQRVLVEGVVFGPAQVAAEIAAYLSR
jgi:hypothetical protein